MTNKVRTKNPNAAVFIYNYRDRLGDEKLAYTSKPTDVDQIILNTVSLKSVSTQKSKSNPAGSFEFRLAPTKNWVTAITPGSWCVILMSNEKIDDAAKYGGGKVKEKSFKMLGRIESVRAVANTNQTTGARETEYIVTGADWGVIFNSNFYVDMLNRSPNISYVGMAERFGYDQYLINAAGGFNLKKVGPTAKVNSSKSPNPTSDFMSREKSTTTAKKKTSSKESKVGLPTARKNIEFLLGFWGKDDPATSAIQGASGLLAKSKQTFTLPSQLVKYMGFVDREGKESPVTAVAQMLNVVSGHLKKYDQYTEDDPSAGVIDFQTILGQHTMWQLLMDNSNYMINELIPEIRFTKDVPKLTLYNRVKPFCVNTVENIMIDRNTVGGGGGTSDVDIVAGFYSQFKNVRRIKIDADDVIMSSAGTNWRDRVNFVEVNIASSLFAENYSSEIKQYSQFKDERSIGRDGLLMMRASTQYIPIKKNLLNPMGVIFYKYLLKEWHFNTHKMLNGTLSLIGQDQYIQVGDNIMVESKVLTSKNYNTNAAQKSTKTKTYLLAHVESVSHNTVVDNNGGRIFTTNINFVRGIITDGNGTLVVSDLIVGAVDQDASLVSPSVELNNQSFGSSGPNDPDRQKLKGN